MTPANSAIQEMQYVLDPAVYEPHLRKIYKTLFRSLVDKYEEALKYVSMLPDNIIRELGETLKHDPTPLSTITTILDRWNHSNFLDPFEIIVRMMLRELISSDHLIIMTLRQAEYLRNNIAQRIIQLYKKLGP